MADRYTEFGLVYRLIDLTAKDDTSSTFTNAMYSSNSSLVNVDSFNPYMTMEHNFSVLDGGKGEFPVTPEDIGMFSSVRSNSSAAYTSKPKITIVTGDYHTTCAITMIFVEDYPKQATAKFYRDSVLIADITLEIDSLDFVVDTPVILYNKVVIEFDSTNIPDRYVKMRGVLFGKIVTWDETTISNASLTQDMSRISDMLSIDTLSFELIDLDNSLNFGNQDGLYKFFQRKQEMFPYEIVDDQKIPLGKFYLDTYSYESSLGKMQAVSFLGLMDGISFEEGDLYNGVRAEVVIDKIFEVCGFTDYTVDDETADQLLYGALPPTTARDALRQVLFACNSILDNIDSQSAIHICKSSGAQIYEMNRDTKISTKVTKQAYVSGVEVQFPQYTLQNDISEISKDEYEVGPHRVVFNTPCLPSSLTITGGTLTKTATYYAEFTVATAGEVIISGKQYAVVNKKLTESTAYIDPGEIENIVKYTSNLCNQATAKLLAKKLLKYHTSFSLYLEVKHIASDITMNDLRAVQNESPVCDNYLGIFSGRTFDLTGGFIDDAKLLAYFNDYDYYYYTSGNTGNEELYSGNNTLL